MMHVVCKSSLPKAKKRLSSVAYGLGRNSAPVSFFLPVNSVLLVIPNAIILETKAIFRLA